MAFPPGGTYFDGKKSFADVPIDESKDNAIATTEFLEAAEALTGLFDVLGSVAFNPVKSDMTGNIKVSKPIYCTRARIHRLLKTENPRPPTNNPSRLREPAIARQNRTQRKETHRDRRPALAQPRPRLHLASPPQKSELTVRRTIQFVPRCIRQYTQKAP
jgi:hypothetical protein